MRMMKRAAVGILAAAMALSMLTACGGASAGPSTSGSTSTGGSSNPGSSSSSSASSSESNGSSSSSSSSSNSSSSTKFTYKDSLAYKYNMQRYNSKTWYEKTEQIDSDGKRSIYETAMVFGSDHRVQKLYYKDSYANGDTYESLRIDGTNYTLHPDVKIAVNNIHKSSGDSSSSSNGEVYKMDSIVKTTQKVNDVSYYTEVMTYKGDKTGKTMTDSYCFDTKGKLVYQISVQNGQEYKTHILDYGPSIPSSVLMEIPSDWSVYTFDYTTTPKTVTDAAGNKLTDDEIVQLNKKIYKW